MNRNTQWAAALVVALAGTAAQAAPIELITNGGFETGDLTGWTTSGLGSPTGTCPSVGRDWNVSGDPSATGCSLPGLPLSGQFAAYVMNDGGVTDTTYTLSQNFVVPVGLTVANLSWSESSVSGYNGQQRSLTVELLQGASVLLSSQQLIPFNDSDTSWDSHLSDVSAVLAAHQGQTLTLRFSNHIPEVWTGPAGLGLDQVSLSATVAAVPEPGSLALVAGGLAIVGMARRRARA